MSSNKSKTEFFRQSGWMVIATFAGGICMALVHSVAGRLPESDYAAFVGLLTVMMMVGLPTSAFQTIFARQAASAVTEAQEDELTVTARALAMGTFFYGLICVGVLLCFSGRISAAFSITNPWAIYFTAVLTVTGFWVPMGKGLLQGKHHFGGLGWLQISDGVVRFGAVLVFILWMHSRVAGAMAAVMAGQLATVALTIWLTKPIWSRPTQARFRWQKWFTAAIPLTFGYGTVLAMWNIDTLFVTSTFTSLGVGAGLYSAANKTGFAVTQFIAPVALVMFSKVTQSVARTEKSNTLKMTLMATATFGLLAAIGFTLLPKLPLQVMFFGSHDKWDAFPLVRWFGWALLPLTVANVLIQNLLARGQFKAVPALVAVPILYAGALFVQKPALLAMAPFDAFTRVIQNLGIASLLLCGIGAWYSRKELWGAPGGGAERAASDTTKFPKA